MSLLNPRSAVEVNSRAGLKARARPELRRSALVASLHALPIPFADVSRLAADTPGVARAIVGAMVFTAKGEDFRRGNQAGATMRPFAGDGV